MTQAIVILRHEHLDRKLLHAGICGSLLYTTFKFLASLSTDIVYSARTLG